nr:hemin uptake protein HemP [Ferrovibrio sp.]
MLPGIRPRQGAGWGIMVRMQSARGIKQLGAGSEDELSPGEATAKVVPPRLNSRQLFETGREVIIEHEGADYRLRLTSNGKLILTK